jgi:8-oxo-dGTP pyrophosphatase MutT (NUDIX family)
MPAKRHDRGEEQVAALPWRRTPEGLWILLITSRETRRCVIPKGWPMKKRTPAEAAAQEAYEEAGVLGVIDDTPLGRYAYEKGPTNRKAQTLQVTVFALEVLVERAAWPEHAQREKRWLAPADAAALIDEDDLSQIVESFSRP